MTTTVRLSSKGQVTIPAEARARLGLDRGDVLTVEVEEGRLVLSRLRGVDELADLVTGWVDDVPPVTDVSAYYEQHRDAEL